MNEQAASGKQLIFEEREPKTLSGVAMLLVNILLMAGAIAALVWSIMLLDAGRSPLLGGVMLAISVLYMCVLGPILFCGLKILRPNEAYVFTLFGQYYGTLKRPGYYYVNPFVGSVNPTKQPTQVTVSTDGTAGQAQVTPVPKRKLSLKVMTLNNERQKVNDLLGNPIVIGIVVIWKVVNTAKAVFSVDNYEEYLSIQCDSALRNIVRLYPYDTSGDDNEKTLRGSSQEIADKLKAEIQEKVAIAGLEIIEARITNLSYAPEIAAAMLQRQQASAIIDARQMIVEGAVGMVEMALEKLNENNIVHLDEERKAAMVSNLLVVLCGNRDAQPVVNSGSLY